MPSNPIENPTFNITENTPPLNFVTPEMFGAVGDGVADDTAAVQSAINSGKAVISSNRYRLTSSIQLSENNFMGLGMTTVFDVDHSGHGFIMPVKTGRGVKLICGFRLISTASKPKTKYAFFFPGTAPGATSISYTSGYTFRDLEIGGGGAFGGGFFLKDAFRVNIDNVGMTSVANPIHVAGSTLQLTVSHTIANSDGADFAAFGSSIGWWMTAENYGGLGVHMPENIKFINSSVVGYDYGAITIGSMVRLDNPDIDYAGVIGWRYDGGNHHVMNGGYIATNNTTKPFSGVNIQTVTPGQAGVEVVNSVITSYRGGMPAGSFAIVAGDSDTNHQGGMVISGVKITGAANSWTSGVRSASARSLSLSGCQIDKGSLSTNDAISVSNQMNISITSCDAGTANIVYGAPAKNAVGVIECNVATVISTGVGTASNFRVFANTPQ